MTWIEWKEKKSWKENLEKSSHGKKIRKFLCVKKVKQNLKIIHEFIWELNIKLFHRMATLSISSEIKISCFCGVTEILNNYKFLRKDDTDGRRHRDVKHRFFSYFVKNLQKNIFVLFTHSTDDFTSSHSIKSTKSTRNSVKFLDVMEIFSRFSSSPCM